MVVGVPEPAANSRCDTTHAGYLQPNRNGLQYVGDGDAGDLRQLGDRKVGWDCGNRDDATAGVGQRVCHPANVVATRFVARHHEGQHAADIGMAEDEFERLLP